MTVHSVTVPKPRPQQNLQHMFPNYTEGSDQVEAQNLKPLMMAHPEPKHMQGQVTYLVSHILVQYPGHVSNILTYRLCLKHACNTGKHYEEVITPMCTLMC